MCVICEGVAFDCRQGRRQIIRRDVFAVVESVFADRSQPVVYGHARQVPRAVEGSVADPFGRAFRCICGRLSAGGIYYEQCLFFVIQDAANRSKNGVFVRDPDCRQAVAGCERALSERLQVCGQSDLAGQPAVQERVVADLHQICRESDRGQRNGVCKRFSSDRREKTALLK